MKIYHLSAVAEYCTRSQEQPRVIIRCSQRWTGTACLPFQKMGGNKTCFHTIIGINYQNFCLLVICLYISKRISVLVLYTFIKLLSYLDIDSIFYMIEIKDKYFKKELLPFYSPPICIISSLISLFCSFASLLSPTVYFPPPLFLEILLMRCEDSASSLRQASMQLPQLGVIIF